jgi:hypothetical protein
MLLFCVKWLPFNVFFFAKVAGVGVVNAVAVKDVVAGVVVSDVVVASVVDVGVVNAVAVKDVVANVDAAIVRDVVAIT